ncbi:MAG TPA: FAD-dependent oxidoreductase [Streptosporangiaceae bacterium]|nr:FAD-dependent oxidoreductase [Streptosporangiaceae bacterium]
MERVDIAVVGAGLLGSATARALAARDVPAVLLEQFGPGHARGSSHGATRIFRLSYPDPGYVRMAVSALEAWARLQDDAGEQLLIRTGGLDAGPGASRCGRALADCRLDHSWLPAGEVRERFPGIAARPGERVLFQPDSGVCLAGRTVAALQRLAQRDGVPLRAHTPVLGIEARGDRALLRTPAGELSAKVAVIAAGPWSERLLTGAVARAPRLTVTLQQVRYFRPNHTGAGAWPTWIEWSDVDLIWYAVPMAGDAPGVKVAAHIPGRAVDPADGPFDQIDPAEDGRAAEYVRARLPGLVPARLGPETCLYTMTADEDFVLDREGPVVVGAGCSGHAFKFGPLLGEMLAGLALGKDAGGGTTRFSLARPALATVPRI